MTEDWRNATATLEPELLDLAAQFQASPEPAYKERRTVDVWAGFAARHKLSYKTALDGGAPMVSLGDARRADTRIVLTADLDAVAIARGQQLQWRHLCGHHAQSTAVLGALLLLSTVGLPQELAVAGVGCPAEECMPAFVKDCAIPFVPGKARLLADGAFSRATAVLSIHLADAMPRRSVIVAHGAHGGLWLRIPTEQPAAQVQEAALRVLCGCAVSIRAVPFSASEYDLIIETAPHAGEAVPRARQVIVDLQRHGVTARLVAEYAPLIHEETLRKLARRVIDGGIPPVERLDALWLAGMTDLGDISQRIPTLQVFVGGTTGVTHQPSFSVTDPAFAYIWPSWFLARMVLEVHAATAKE